MVSWLIDVIFEGAIAVATLLPIRMASAFA